MSLPFLLLVGASFTVIYWLYFLIYSILLFLVSVFCMFPCFIPSTFSSRRLQSETFIKPLIQTHIHSARSAGGFLNLLQPPDWLTVASHRCPTPHQPRPPDFWFPPRTNVCLCVCVIKAVVEPTESRDVSLVTSSVTVGWNLIYNTRDAVNISI